MNYQIVIYKVALRMMIFFGILIATLSCKEEILFEDREPDGTPPGEVEILEIVPGAGKLIVKWVLPNDDDFLYVQVSYPNDNEERLLTYSKYNRDSIIIPYLNDEEYTFTFRTVDETGTVSNGVIHSGTPLTPAFKIAAQTVEASVTIGAIIFNWQNPTEDTLLASVFLKTDSGDSLLSVKYTGSNTSFRVSADERPGKYYLEFKDPEYNYAISDIFNLASVPEIKFDRTDFSSNYSGYSPFMRVFDGLFDSHFAMGPPFPKTINFNYEKPVLATRLLFYVSRASNEVNITHFPEKIEIWTSLTGEFDDYFNQGEFILKQVAADKSDWYEPREVVLTNVPECRFFRLVVTSTYSNQACVIGEMEVFGAEIPGE